ncbi:MAG: uroporphyrinogen decarboxylase family protein [Planctomycetota bacterium]
MNSKQRTAAAMAHKKPDRVPVMCQLALGHYFLHCGYNPSEIWFNSKIFAGAQVELQQKYNFDGILLNLSGRPPDWKNNLKSYKKIGNNEHLLWKSGLETVFPPDDNPQTYQPEQMPLERANYNTVDIDNPATYRLSGYVWNTWHAPELWDIEPEADLCEPTAYPEWFTGSLRKARQLAPEISIHTEVFSPFTHLMELFGYEQALFALLDTPATCHKALTFFTRMVLAQVELYAGCHPDAILVSSAFAGAGFISRQMYEEFVAPYEDLVYKVIRRFGIKSYVHTCGAIGDRLDLMSRTAVDGIDTLDPPPLGTVHLEDAKSKYGHRFFFKGNLDAVNEMLNADDKTFEEAVKERIRIGKPGSGYILSSACSVAPHVKSERLIKLAALSEQFGKY